MGRDKESFLERRDFKRERLFVKRLSQKLSAASRKAGKSANNEGNSDNRY